MGWRNDGSARLYCVKRKYAEIYHTGGSKTGCQPQLYQIGAAKANVNRLNKLLDTGPTKTYEEWLGKRADSELLRGWYKYYLELKEAGPWVVAEIQLCASEIQL